MKRSFAALCLSLLAAACGDDPNVVVRAAVEPGGEPITGLPVRLMPYDRQALLDSLAGEYGHPQPAVPQELLQRLEAAGADDARRDSLLRQVQALQAARRAWEDSAYAGFERAARARLDDLGVAEQVDTTDARGRAAFTAGTGQWWVYARYVLPDHELVWNVPVTLHPDSVIVRLTRENAKVRPFP